MQQYQSGPEMKLFNKSLFKENFLNLKAATSPSAFPAFFSIPSSFKVVLNRSLNLDKIFVLIRYNKFSLLQCKHHIDFPLLESSSEQPSVVPQIFLPQPHLQLLQTQNEQFCSLPLWSPN